MLGFGNICVAMSLMWNSDGDHIYCLFLFLTVELKLNFEFLILEFGKCCSFHRSHFCCIVSVWFSWSKCNRKHSVQTFKLSSQLEWFVSGFREIILVAFISIKFNAHLSWKATSVLYFPAKVISWIRTISNSLLT